jgi:hypothetical protein
LKLFNQGTALFLVFYILFNPFPSGGAILIGYPNRLMKSLVNLLPVRWGNGYASLIKDIFYMPKVTGHCASPPFMERSGLNLA